MIPDETRLFLEAELFDDRVVTALVFRLEIAQVCAAVCDHLQESSA